MPNIQSAVKRVKTSEKSRLRNKAVKTKITSVRRKAFDGFETKDKEAATQLFREYCSVLDKAAKKGIIKKNTAIRRKRRSAAKLAALK